MIIQKLELILVFCPLHFFFFFLFIKESDLLFLLSLKTFHGFLEKWYQPPGPKFKSDESWSLDGRLYNSTGQSVRCSL